MRTITNPVTYYDVIRAAKKLDASLTRKQTQLLIENCTDKIRRAMIKVTEEIISEETENFCLDEEDKELCGSGEFRQEEVTQET